MGWLKSQKKTPERIKPKNKLYNTRAWVKCRAATLAMNPFCANCDRIATDVHHLDIDNHPFDKLVCLCHGCHSSITRQEQLRKK